MSKRTINFRYAPTLSWTCIGLPDDEHKSIVRQDGSLQYGTDRVITFGLRHTSAAAACRQETEGAESAVVRTILDYGFAQLHLTTFADLDAGRRRDVVLWELRASADLRVPLIGALVPTSRTCDG